jgi:hypothetical protein
MTDKPMSDANNELTPEEKKFLMMCKMVGYGETSNILTKYFDDGEGLYGKSNVLYLNAVMDHDPDTFPLISQSFKELCASTPRIPTLL